MARFEEQKLYIGGRYVEASSGATFETINPANGEVLAKVQEHGLSPANYNGGGQLVVAGPLEALAGLAADAPRGAP